jgi:hypothetical protein
LLSEYRFFQHEINALCQRDPELKQRNQDNRRRRFGEFEVFFEGLRQAGVLSGPDDPAARRNLVTVSMNRYATSAARWVAAIGLILGVTAAKAQAGEWVLLAGLAQPALFRGGNVAATYISDGGWVLDYSHGWNLHLDAFEPSLTKAERRQELGLLVPYTTGFGIGRQVGKDLDLRLEVKEHRYQVTHPDGGRVSYTTRSVGAGAYYRYRFAASGWLLEPSLRYWPNVYSTLRDDKHTFPNGDVHEAHDFGLFANVSLGFAF